MDICKALAVPVVMFVSIIAYMFLLSTAFNFFSANPASLVLVGVAAAAIIIVKHESISKYLHQVG